MSDARKPVTSSSDRRPHTGEVETTQPSKAIALPADMEAANEATQSLFDDQELSGFRNRWEAVQTGFVDEPKAAVNEADALVTQVVSRLTEVFTEERSRLEAQLDRGDDLSTEDLRLAFRRYRAFFDRLLRV
jgi:hypothetical protein